MEVSTKQHPVVYLRQLRLVALAREAFGLACFIESLLQHHVL